MVNNNLYKVENTLRSIAKRYKSVKYSLGLAILFLMMGVSAFSEEVVAQGAVAQQEVMTTEQIASSKENLRNSVGSLQSKIDAARAENEKGLAGLRLELIQLMEQGDQVVKSPWASWQFGANYMYNKWSGAYKGRGDKSEKYPFEGIFSRSTNVFGRVATARTADQKATLNSIIAANGGFNPNGNGLSYGLITRAQINEDPMTIEVSAGIRPKNIQKGAITLNVPPVNVQPPRPSLTTINPVAPAAPNINIPSFAPVAPDVTPPNLPTPPTFAVILGADCNEGCDSNAWRVSGPRSPRQRSNASIITNTNSSQNTTVWLHYTWTDPSIPAEQNYAFKMYAEATTTDITDPKFVGQSGHSNPGANTRPSGNEFYFNSYNFGGTTEFAGGVLPSVGQEKNDQYFFIGGSRFWEIDNVHSGTFNFPQGKTLNLGGILTLGMVSQQNGTTLRNSGTITDAKENVDNYIKNINNKYNVNVIFNPDGTVNTEQNVTAGTGQYLKILGPGNNNNYYIRKSTDGYVGYKVGIAQVYENGDGYTQGNQILENAGNIDFRGKRSIGMYVYIPNDKSYAIMENKVGANITLSGEESYGMKFASKAESRASMTNNGTITLKKNINDKADNSAAMALMVDKSVTNKVSLDPGKAVNNGDINLQDNIGNSLGMFVSIDSNMTNNKNINISARASKTNNKYNLNSGMRADQVEATYSTAATYNTTVINDTGANINITGQGAIGMVANGKTTVGTATAINRGTISVDKGTSTVAAEQGKDSYGMLATNQASIVNETTGKINIGTSPNSVGMTSIIQGTNVSKAENKGEINITGPNSTGVYNTGEFLMNTATAKINVAGRQSIGLYAKGTATQTKTELKAGTVQASNSGVGLYSDKATVTIDNSTNNLKLIANNGGLLFYNYDSGVTGTPVANGKFRLTGSKDATATINNGGYAFYLKNTHILSNGSINGLAAFFNSMFDNANSTKKIDITLNPGGTLMILDKPIGGDIKLSSVSTVGNIASSLGGRVTVNNASTKYKVYAVYRGKLEIDQNVNLDKDSTTTNPDAFYKVDFRSSTMKLDTGKTMTGTKQGQVALFQGNYDEGGTSKGKVGDISIINNGTIRLTGNSTANATTTAMAGDFITLINNKNIEVTGNNAVGIYGAGGSKITNAKNGTITVGQEGVALYGANRLGTSTLGDKTISVTNAGTLKGVSGKTKVFGIFAENNLALNSNISKAALTNNGTIDFTNSKQSIGIHSINSTVTNTGNIKIGEGGAAINAKNSNITSAGNITLTNKAVAFNLGGSFTGRTLNFTSKVTLTGNENSIFNLKDMTFNAGSGLTENLNIVSNNKSFSYFSMDNSVLTYNKNKTFAGNKVTLVSAKNSTVNWNSNLTLSGAESVAFYLNGTKAGATAPELTIAAGKTITLTGNKSVGAYGVSGARIVNNGNITVGANGAALYSTGAGTLRNTGILTVGKNSVGMYMKDGTNLTHTGQINSTQEGAKGIVVNRGTAATYTNNGRINLTGTSSIGIHAEGAAHTIENRNSVTVGNTTGKDQSVAIHLKDGGTVRNFNAIKAGNKSIGIYGTTVLASLEANSSVQVGDGAIGIYAKDGNVNLNANSKMSIGKTAGTNQEAVGVYYVGNGGTVNNNLTSLTIGKGSIGLVDAGTGSSTINNNLSSVQLPGDAVYTYTSNARSNVIGNTKITSSGNGNYGYYVAGNLTNNANASMDFSSGTGNVGVYSAYRAGGTGVARNAATITVGKTDLENELYSIGMAAGYTNTKDTTQNRVGHVINTGTINVNYDNSIGMYASGVGSTAENQGTINITGKKAIGMYLENGATGINAVGANITIEPAAQSAIAVYSTGKGTTFKNYGTITLKAPSSKGIVTANDGTGGNVSGGTIIVQNASAEKTKNIEGTAGGDKRFGDKTLSVPKGGRTPSRITDANGNVLKPADIDVTSGTNISVTTPGTATYNRKALENHDDLSSVSRIGMYVDTSGVNFTNPIQGLQHLRGLQKADLIIGAEATEYTNAKTLTVGQNILRRYNTALDASGLEKYDIISGSLTWAAATNRINGTGKIQSIVMTKTDYKEYAKNSTTPYNFLDGLEQRYDMNTLDSKEKRVFNKLNGIGKNEAILLSQAFDEMLGQQYANVQQRVQATGDILDKEFNYLRDEWRTASKDSNKIKTFGTRGEYKTETAGIKDYKYNAYGVAYVHENEDIKLGRGTGWYTGIVHNTFKFKDIGNSKEQMLQAKVGLLKSVPFDENNSLNWTISGDVFVGRNRMDRRFLVVDEVFHAKSRYYTYGIGIKNEIGKEVRLSEGFSVRPYAALRLEYGRTSKIREKNGEVRLEVKQNDYFSVRPELGAELVFKHYFGMKALTTSAGVAYENELGRVANAKNKARVGYTSAGWYDLRGEKEDRRGNVKFDFNVGVDNTRVGVTANVGYDTKGENLRGGLGLRVIF